MSADAFMTPDFESNLTFLSLNVRFLLDGGGTLTGSLFLVMLLFDSRKTDLLGCYCAKWLSLLL